MTPRMLLLIATFASSALAQSDWDLSHASNRIRIKIEVENNRTCQARTHVSLVSDSGPAVAEGYANAQCVVEFSAVPVGNYHLIVAGPNITETDSRKVEIDAREVQELEVPVRIAEGPTAGKSALVAVGELTVPHGAKKNFDSATRLIARNEFPQALERLQKAIEIDPEYAEAYNDLGVVYDRMGNSAQSRESFERAIQLNDHLAPAYVNLARTEVAARDFHSAEALLEKATASGVESPDVLILLASVELLTQHFDLALANCRMAHATTRTPHAAAHYIAARAFEHQDRPAEAIAELRQLLDEEKSGLRAEAARKEIAVLQAASR